MNIEILKSKLSGAVITQTELHYEGSITIDQDIMKVVDLVEYEKVSVLNVNNGERLETYVIKGDKGSGVICLNGPAARKAVVGDEIIILSYVQIAISEAKRYSPIIISLEKTNALKD